MYSGDIRGSKRRALRLILGEEHRARDHAFGSRGIAAGARLQRGREGAGCEQLAMRAGRECGRKMCCALVGKAVTRNAANDDETCDRERIGEGKARVFLPRVGKSERLGEPTRKTGE